MGNWWFVSLQAKESFAKESRPTTFRAVASGSLCSLKHTITVCTIHIDQGGPGAFSNRVQEVQSRKSGARGAFEASHPGRAPEERDHQDGHARGEDLSSRKGQAVDR